MGPADPFGSAARPPASAPTPEPALAPRSPHRAADWTGFGFGVLFGLIGLLAGFPQAGVVLLCGLIGAGIGGLYQRRQVFLRWLVQAAERAA